MNERAVAYRLQFSALASTLVNLSCVTPIHASLVPLSHSSFLFPCDSPIIHQSATSPRLGSDGPEGAQPPSQSVVLSNDVRCVRSSLALSVEVTGCSYRRS